ncbi:DUF1800 domain-containing protein [Flavobacterium agrisoli]|uniref:DUF1800 domain-containing protein n=1 Tax=Flavobacterium agrisoli TaxID=2793066 RepID=A0A934UKP9_9FLAO|nr:DUF1800 domain-containing protein [Flavobacterium agrisoli]MBK0370788.1 DUF1800 domain-containing protein [Flavobacterium agrisoli]
MNQNTLWSLRLGFSNKEAQKIDKMGFKSFLSKSFAVKNSDTIPDFLKTSPKTKADFAEKRTFLKTATAEEKKEIQKESIHVLFEMKNWWIEKMMTAEFPLQEKMTLFLHNHYVATYQKVKANYWIYQHNQVIRKNAFGNFKTLTKEILKTNAMVRYLDNTDNRKGKINENLSRELLELFTLGIGNYTENDIQNGAKALAGLGIGDEKAEYNPRFQDRSSITYFGKKGVFDSDAIVDIIFEQKSSPYLMTRKILKWFLYDYPSEDLVQYYGDYFRKVDFEFQPLLKKIFTEEFEKNTAGTKIKNPIEFSLQLVNELELHPQNLTPITQFIKSQSMDLFNQPNVKGWEGGKSWLTTQIYLQRNLMADRLCNGNLNPKTDKKNKKYNVAPKLEWQKGTNLTIIKELSQRLLFEVNPENQKDFESILKYDFDPEAPNANQAVVRLFNEMIKQPEFQLI